jgi:hypothetical protein
VHRADGAQQVKQWPSGSESRGISTLNDFHCDRRVSALISKLKMPKMSESPRMSHPRTAGSAKAFRRACLYDLQSCGACEH